MGARRTRPKPLKLDVDLEAEVLFESFPGQKTKARRIDGRKLKLPSGVRYWFTLRTVGGDLDIVLARPEHLADLKDCTGVTHADVGLIALDDSTPLLRLVVALIHEALHGVLTAPGDDELLAGILGVSRQRAERVHEWVVTHVAPRLADCLLRSRLLVLPPIPRRKRTKRSSA